MLFTREFLKTLIFQCFLILLIVNIAFTFDMRLGIDVFQYSSYDTYTDRYFGVTTFITAWDNYFGHSEFLSTINETINYIINGTKQLSASQLYKTLLIESNVDTNVITEIGRYLFMIYDSLFNIVYILSTLLSVILYIFYGLSFAIQFILFFFYFVGGSVATQLPNTYGDLQQLQNVIL